MEYKYQNANDDFRVKYILEIPDNSECKLSNAETDFLNQLDEAYEDIERLTNQADGYDYAIAISCGIIAGFVDSFFVGDWDFKSAKKASNIEINNKIMDFAKKDPQYIDWCNGVDKSNRWNKRDPNRLASAVEFLEGKYVLPGDNDYKFKGSGISPKTHHLDDFCHHPTLIGMICSILVQFTGMSEYHPSTGGKISVPVTINEYNNFVSDNAYGKIFSGIINWFFKASQTLKNQKGHLLSDMAGSLSATKEKHYGSGVPGTVMSTLKELSTLPCFKESDFAENLRKAYQNGIGEKDSQLNLGIFNNLFDGATSKFDARTENAVKHELKRQSVPVIINEILVRTFYFVRRFIEQMKMKKSPLELDWKKLLPANNRTIVRMIVISSGTFCLADLGDAAVRSGIKSGGNLATFGTNFIIKVNFVGIGRFTLAVGSDLYMEARKERLKMAVTSGEIAVVAMEEKQVIADTSDINKRTDDKIEKMKMITKEIEKNIL